MSEDTYAQIQSYATCEAGTWQTILQRYGQALTRLGCTDPRVQEWLTTIPWPTSDEDGFGDVFAAPVLLRPHGSSSPHQEITCAGIEISLYVQSGIPTLEDPPIWLGLNLLLDTELLRTQATDPYQKGVGGSIWLILRELASTFSEVGAYFTDPWQENLAWRAIVENSGDPWTFELAIFPRSLADHFKEVPPGFQGTVLEAAFGFAQVNRWPVLPWVEAESGR